ncbi:VOC family protein [Microbacterium sp. ABRD28]|uniref:bleomycin resistance protein n=1 Tax=Microbacterium sp. ABRD28 TaxID=2268461 RepID=UPI000F54FE13|nr:VOC family protein [Microbacterium sp. ABRD28]AZC13115.1 VOC family protein [Microbacterium sp. ABRD28]
MRESAVPILLSRDLRRTLRFYEALGFEDRGSRPPEEWHYLILARGDIALHFSEDPELDPLTTASMCYLCVDDAESLYEQWRAHVVPDAATGHRITPPATTEYGLVEFALVDPDGNLVRVGSPLPA